MLSKARQMIAQAKEKAEEVARDPTKTPLFEVGARPDFITTQDIERWDTKIEQLIIGGDDFQYFQTCRMLQEVNGLEHFYSGEWLGEQLAKQGFIPYDRSAICYQHGRLVGLGAKSWEEAQKIAGAGRSYGAKTSA